MLAYWLEETHRISDGTLEQTTHGATMRSWHTFKLCAEFVAVVFTAGILLPGAVFCYESNGDATLEYGRCLADPSSRTHVLSHFFELSGPVCDSCVDAPVFQMLSSRDQSYRPPSVVVSKATAALFLAVPLHSGICGKTPVSHPPDFTTLSLSCVNSTVLRI